MLQVNYYFLRFHISTATDIESKLNFILKGLSSKAVVEQYGYSFKFFDIESINEDDTIFITGHLVKYTGDYDEEVVDEKLSGLTETNIKNKVVGKVRFFLMPDSALIAFHEQGNILNRSIFQNKFSELFDKNFDNYFVKFSTSPIVEQYSFLEEVKKFKSIKKVEINLIPSNPRFSDRWKTIDERLRINHITNYKEILENKLTGSVEIDKETESKIYMSEDGYGEASAHGLDVNGEKKSISTKSRNKVAKKSVPADFLDATSLLRLLMPVLLEIVKRTKK